VFSILAMKNREITAKITPFLLYFRIINNINGERRQNSNNVYKNHIGPSYLAKIIAFKMPIISTSLNKFKCKYKNETYNRKTYIRY